MAIVQEINESYFAKRFHEMGRGDNFTFAALSELYNYYDSLSDDTGEDIKLDVICICCEWSELTAEEVEIEYSNNFEYTSDDVNNDITLHEAALAYLEQETTAIDCGGTILFQSF